MVARNISSTRHTSLGRNMIKRSMSFKHDDCQLCEVQTMSVLFHTVALRFLVVHSDTTLIYHYHHTTLL